MVLSIDKQQKILISPWSLASLFKFSVVITSDWLESNWKKDDLYFYLRKINIERSQHACVNIRIHFIMP